MLLLMLTLERGVRIGLFSQNPRKNTQKSQNIRSSCRWSFYEQNEIKPYQETKKKVKDYTKRSIAVCPCQDSRLISLISTKIIKNNLLNCVFWCVVMRHDKKRRLCPIKAVFLPFQWCDKEVVWNSVFFCVVSRKLSTNWLKMKRKTTLFCGDNVSVSDGWGDWQRLTFQLPPTVSWTMAHWDPYLWPLPPQNMTTTHWSHYYFFV